MKLTTSLVVAVAVVVALAGACSDDEPVTFSGNPVTEGTVSPLDTELGDVLVDPWGDTVYVFTPDGTDGVPTCVDTCARTWLPYQPDVLAGEYAQRLSMVDRPDGSAQAALDGRPLYLFVGDDGPGSTAGHRSAGVWFALDPDGEPIA